MLPSRGEFSGFGISRPNISEESDKFRETADHCCLFRMILNAGLPRRSLISDIRYHCHIMCYILLGKQDYPAIKLLQSQKCGNLAAGKPHAVWYSRKNTAFRLEIGSFTVPLCCSLFLCLQLTQPLSVPHLPNYKMQTCLRNRGNVSKNCLGECWVDSKGLVKDSYRFHGLLHF